ncbi:asparaginase [Candidatus Gracilibacteria bacterium]|nr:MAG: asparaginase [Candidatus Gracilibacteria bacterium]
MIQIFAAGGTIDVNEIKNNDEYMFAETYIPKMLKQGNCTIPIDVKTIFLKDSLYITDKDRDKIVTACKESPQERIIITHGTDTMVDMAKLLAKKVDKKTIVLVGSMIPFIQENSDALFNIGSAITSVQLLKNGVYIVMNGQIFSWDNAKKNIDLKIFEKNT